MIRLATAALALALAGCSPPPAAPYAEGAPFPRFGGGGSTGAVLVWVLASEDHLGCETDARAIRIVQRRHGTPLTVVAAGADAGWVASFLARERLEAELVGLSRAEFRSRAGKGPASALYVVQGGTVAAVFPAGAGELLPERLEAVLPRVTG